MSASYLNKAHGRVRKAAGKLSRNPDEPSARRWNMLVLLPLWVTLAYFAGNIIVLIVMAILELMGVSIESLVRPAILDTVLATVIYSLTIAIAIGTPYIWKRRTSMETLGLQRLPSWSDIGLAPVAFIIYMLITTIVLMTITSWISGFPSDQAQDVGFNSLGSQGDNVLAFLTLVVLAPIAEEILFRGYLYGKLKGHVPTVVAAIVTSLLFALAHFQWNVGIDVFVLSLILCWLRSLTGSIWAGILVHMIKNGIAYYLLFINPILGG